MKKLLLLAVLFTSTSLCYLNAQLGTLRTAGTLPTNALAQKVLVYVEGDCNYRALQPAVAVLKELGYRVLLDGERTRVHSGLVTSVTVADTSFTRRAQDLVIRRIHGSERPDYVLIINGSYQMQQIRHLEMSIIGFETGELLAYSTAPRGILTTRYNTFERELRAIFGRDGKPSN